MRWGIFSDIHGNLEALKAVVAAFGKEDIDKYLCLGDIVGYGANPRECIAQVKKMEAVTIAGNHDWAAVDLFDPDLFNPHAKTAVLWTGQNLAQEDREYLKNLDLVFQQEELTLVHASLDSPEQFEYVLDVSATGRTFSLLKTRLCFIGHSHIPAIFSKQGQNYRYLLQPKLKIEDDKTYIINTGSVGQPRDGDPRATYVVYDSKAGQLQIKRVSYDLRQTQDKIIQAGLPWILAERLAIGT
ncbi:MAG: metallophosphoesterase family protein [Candidatus Omnitrophica bacterium]|nr:metallophosphoesterase family protein [Candidatus Omnitrophota bacterium]